jgi:hypothetical protein
MVLRDLHSAEQEARQRLRAMSGAILSHLDDTEQLVAESSGNFRAIVQAHPEATELRSSSTETMSDVVERAALVAEAAVVAEAEAHADRVALDAEHAARAAERLAAADEAAMRPARMRRTSIETLETLDTGVASGETADAFFDAPPSFDPNEIAERRERVASFAEYEE